MDSEKSIKIDILTKASEMNYNKDYIVSKTNLKLYLYNIIRQVEKNSYSSSIDVPLGNNEHIPTKLNNWENLKSLMKFIAEFL